MSAQCRHGLIRYECWKCRDEANQSTHVAHVFAGGLVTAVQQLEAKDAEMARLRSDLAAARADAERYRWLRGDVQDDFSTRWSRWRIEHWASPGPTWSDIRGADLDAAIDAAIAGEKK